jgi:hypothetical protein
MAKRNVLKLDTSLVLFTVIGISSHENDYRLSWNMNENLLLNLVQIEDFAIDTGMEFTRFKHEDEERTLYLISNRCNNGFLLEKFRNFDFILKIEPELTDTELTGWLQDLRRAPLISAVLPIPVNRQILQKLA